ncbi:MAG TPA: methyltransferase domain-containing protein [Acidimicrobiia bacterium]|nr:methyltransferase domain-containing protein [Acidimicrobiia bacterium]
MGSNADWASNFASAGVDSMTAYDEILVPRLFDPFADVLLDGVAVSPGVGVLDVACGPGTVTRRVAPRLGPEGRVTACDISSAMLEVAAGKPALGGAAPITYRQCPADELDVPDGGFDIVLCQQGLQFFPDRLGALAEMRRVLKPGGRAGVAVWCAIEENPFWDALATAVGWILGKEAEIGYRSGPWGLPESDELARLFDVAEFVDVDVSRHALPTVFEGGPAQLVATLAAASVGPQVAALDAAGRAALLSAAEATLAPLIHDGEVRSEAATHIVVAVR